MNWDDKGDDNGRPSSRAETLTYVVAVALIAAVLAIGLASLGWPAA